MSSTDFSPDNYNDDDKDDDDDDDIYGYDE